jgi:hypothetical protein
MAMERTSMTSRGVLWVALPISPNPGPALAQDAPPRGPGGMARAPPPCGAGAAAHGAGGGAHHARNAIFRFGVSWGGYRLN